jgi:hypothetical protein
MYNNEFISKNKNKKIWFLVNYDIVKLRFGE